METTTHPHPHPQPHPHHRKIDLQSPADLLYLQRNLSTSATEKLNLHFPPKHAYATHIPLVPLQSQAPSTAPQSPSPQTQPPSDPMRLRVESLVNTFLAEIWAGAKHSISVNGLDAQGVPDLFTPSTSASSTETETETETEVEGTHFTYTPYDPRLSAKLASLHAELESLTSDVSNLRRTNPRGGAEAYLQTLNSTLEDDEAIYDSQRADAARVPDEEVLQIRPIPTDAPELYERGLSELSGLCGLGAKSLSTGTELGKKRGRLSLSLTETVGKVQRASRVVGELE